MKFLKKLGVPYLVMLFVCALIIIVSESLFLSGNKLHGIFIGLWAPMLLGLIILFKLVDNGSKWYRTLFFDFYCRLCYDLGNCNNKSVRCYW